MLSWGGNSCYGPAAGAEGGSGEGGSGERAADLSGGGGGRGKGANWAMLAHTWVRVC